MSLDNSQITIPDSLAEYLDTLPTQKEIANHRPKKCRELPRKHKKDE